jgi:TraB/PrgY/gumN family
MPSPTLTGVRLTYRFGTVVKIATLAMATSLVGVAVSRADPDSQAAPIEEILVTGEQPGPGIWRVSHNGHDLWVLASLDLLPKKMTWHSREVELRIAQSQTVLSPPQVSANVGFFKALTLIPSLLRAEKSPDGKTLEQLLPHDVYIRWLALRVKFNASADDEKKRPMVAVYDLYRRAIDQSGLTSEEVVWETVQKVARQSHVTVTPVTLKLELDDPKGTIKDLGSIAPAAEVDCFTKTIDRLESDLLPMMKRANYWSRGDMEGLKSLPHADDRAACTNAFLTAPKIRDQMNAALDKIFAAWLVAADDALVKNQSTFAVLPIDAWLSEEGLLAHLRAKGYEIQEP